jgi:hypothetical protein
MAKWFRSLGVVIVFAAIPAMAVDRPGAHRAGNAIPRIGAHFAHVGDSPFAPDPEDDTLFIVDEGDYLDTGCSYRFDGPLRIRLLVSRYVGPVNGDGTLQNPAELVSRNLLSSRARLKIPVYDVDMHGDPDDPSVPPEVDRITFNGKPLGTLTGANETWKYNDFEIPIEWVRFGKRGVLNAGVVAGENIIEIAIDQASTEQNWCTAVDWARLEFAAIAPVFLVHGTAAQSDTWNAHFVPFFNNSKAPWSNDINLEPNGSIAGNGRRLGTALTRLANSFGARKCHIIAHSKGGLDTRAYLNQHYDAKKLRVLSVYTLGTPHHGSVLSDIAVAARAAENPESPDADIQAIIDIDWWLDIGGVFSNQVPQGDALENQTTAAMATFNRDFPNVPGDVLFYNYGADADTNDNGTIQEIETTEAPSVYKPARATSAYRVLGNTATIQVEEGTRPGRVWGTNTFTSITVASATGAFAQNDLVTTASSAHSPGGIYLQTRDANHFSLKSEALATAILQRILSDFPNSFR